MFPKPNSTEERREGGREREKTKSYRKFSRCSCREQLLVFSLLLCILGLFKRRGISRADLLCCAAPQIQREGRFVASFVPYFAFKIFKAPQKAL